MNLRYHMHNFWNCLINLTIHSSAMTFFLVSFMYQTEHHRTLHFPKLLTSITAKFLILFRSKSDNYHWKLWKLWFYHTYTIFTVHFAPINFHVTVVILCLCLFVENTKLTLIIRKMYFGCRFCDKYDRTSAFSLGPNSILPSGIQAKGCHHHNYVTGIIGWLFMAGRILDYWSFLFFFHLTQTKLNRWNNGTSGRPRGRF